MSKRWAAIDAEEKKKFEELAKKEKEDYIAKHGARAHALRRAPQDARPH